MIGKFEANKDLIQELTSSGARHVGNIATIITATAADVTREIDEWITDAIEMNEAAQAAHQDASASAAEQAPPGADTFEADPLDGDLLEAEIVERGPAGPELGDRR